jgi:hypothetical protein
MPSPKLKLTIEITYEPVPENYGNGNKTPQEMADIDWEGFNNNQSALMEYLENHPFKLSIVPV